LALEGKLLTDSTNAGGQVEKESEKLGQEDLLVLEDQLDNMLDFEPESDNDEEENSSKEKKKNDEKAEESGDDEIMLIEEVKFDETESKKGKKETSKKEPAKKGVAPQPKSVTAEKPAVEKKEPVAEVEETYSQLGKLIQIRKPNTRTNPVTSCILELFNGKHAGKLVSAVTSSIYMWGYNLAKANLNAVVKYGDTCQVEYKIQPKKEDSEFTDELLVVKKVYFGPKLDKPVRPAHNSSFSCICLIVGWMKLGSCNGSMDNLQPSPIFLVFLTSMKARSNILSGMPLPTLSLASLLMLFQRNCRSTKMGNCPLLKMME